MRVGSIAKWNVYAYFREIRPLEPRFLEIRHFGIRCDLKHFRHRKIYFRALESQFGVQNSLGAR